MKKLKKILSMVLVVCMIFTSQAFVTFAENVGNTEETTTESVTVEASEETVGASSTSPEEDAELKMGGANDNPEDDKLDAPKNEEQEDEFAETDYAEEPEEDEIETEAEVETEVEETTDGSSSASAETEAEIEIETEETTAEAEVEEAIVGAKFGEPEEIEANTEDKLLGDTPHKFILVGKDDDDAGTTIKFTVDDTIENYGVWGNGWNDSGLVTGGEKHGKRGFYTIAQGDSLDEDAVVSSWDETHAIDPDPDAKYNSYIQYKFEAWFDNPTYDIAFGYLFGDEPAPAPSTYTLKYDQNLPTGYTLNSTATWYEDDTKDLDNGESFTIEGSSAMTCSDSNGTVRTLLGWAETATGAKSFDFGNVLSDKASFSENNKRLYAVWSGVFHVIYYTGDADYDSKTLSYIDFTGDDPLTAIAQEKYRKLDKLSTLDLAGFYYMGNSSNVEYYKGQYNKNEATEYGPSEANLESAYREWLKGAPGSDATYGAIYYGKYLIYFYMTYEGSIIVNGNAFLYDEKSDFVDYLSQVENNPPTGKKFKNWQVWDCTAAGYDHSGLAEAAYYQNLVEDSSKFKTAAELASDFDSWVSSGYRVCKHVGAIYEDDTPTPPGPTPVTTDWYWYLDGTHMHYTATNGTGRTKVTFNGDLGVDYGSTSVTTVTEVTIDDKISPENLHGLFRLFTSLTKINSFTNLDTSNCTDMARMFQSCSSLESINVSHFNTSKVKDMSRVFQNCEKLKSVDVSNFDTQNAEKMDQMFGTCLVITDIKFSSKFVTNKVTKMYDMFSRCEKITSLDISSFDVSSVTSANDMFASCHELVTIKTSPTLDFSSVGSGNDMFKYCFKIKGGKGTTYDENHVDKSYAHVDGGTSNPGYFTSSGGPTPPGPTPPGPTPPSPGGGDPGGSSSGPSDPTHGPMGDLTKNPLYADTLNETNNIPESKMVSNDTLATTLKTYPENANSPMVNARDDSGNVGYGQWLRVPNTTTWYFLSGSFNQGTGTTNTGFLANGWFNLGWDGQDKWYYFDGAGVMKIGWHQEGNKIYYLQADFSDNWYGKAMTGQQMIGGQIYNFDSNGVLIQ